MTLPGQLTQCLRMLLLPMRAGNEAACAKALGRTLREMGVQREDFRAWVELNTGLWKDTTTPTIPLCAVVRNVLQAADHDHVALLSEKYFDVHRQLMAEHFMSHEEARAFLTNAYLMIDLARLERLSGAQISKLLSNEDHQVQFSRQSVNYLMASLGYNCLLHQKQVARLYMRDASSEFAFFADADVQTAAEIVDVAAKILGCTSPIMEALGALAPANDLAYFPPYLQVLHYQCTIAEFYDHSATDMYEFSPRGNAAMWLFEQYPDALATAGNPYLNNLKSVGTLDDSWVRSKKQKARPGAKSLLTILLGLDSMGFSARRELAKILRLWLHRILRLSEPLTIALPDTLTEENVKLLLAGVAKENTCTFGVIEQRVVDAISSLRHPIEDGWRSRGIGDSVNTTNISRRKIGDCDYQNSATHKIVAYESHGGNLTDIYVDEHLRTLAKVIELRLDELRGIAELADWEIVITFVAHSISLDPRQQFGMSGVAVTLKFETFDEFRRITQLASPKWTSHVLLPLKERRTPSEARMVLLNLAGISVPTPVHSSK